MNNHAYNKADKKTPGYVANVPNSSFIPVTGQDIHIHYRINILQRFGSLRGIAVQQGIRYILTSSLYIQTDVLSGQNRNQDEY